MPKFTNKLAAESGVVLMKRVCFFTLFLFSNCISFGQVNNKYFEGVLYYTTKTVNGETDTVTLYIQKNKILSIWNYKVYKMRGTTKRLIVANDSLYEYQFQDKRKVILKGIPGNEFTKRNFTLLNGRDTIAGFPSLQYYSSYTTNDNPRKVTNTYKKAISVSPDLKFKDKGNYLVNFFVYKGNFITRIIDTFFFADSKAPYLVEVTLMKIDYKKPDDKLFDLPKDYVIQPFSDKLFRKLFMEPDEEEIEEAVKEIQRRKKQTYKIPPDYRLLFDN